MTRVLRPGMLDMLFAKLRKASSTLRTPKSASALLNEGPIEGGAIEATIAEESPLGETVEVFNPITTCFRRPASAVKFCEMWTVPPKFGNRDQTVGPGVCVNEFCCRSPGLSLIPHVHGRVVEE